MILLAFFFTRKSIASDLRFYSEEINVWVNQNLEEDNNYSVHYKGKYHFDVYKVKGGWIAESKAKRAPEVIDQQLVQNLCQRIVT